MTMRALDFIEDGDETEGRVRLDAVPVSFPKLVAQWALAFAAIGLATGIWVAVVAVAWAAVEVLR